MRFKGECTSRALPGGGGNWGTYTYQAQQSRAENLVFLKLENRFPQIKRPKKLNFGKIGLEAPFMYESVPCEVLSRYGPGITIIHHTVLTV